MKYLFLTILLLPVTAFAFDYASLLDPVGPFATLLVLAVEYLLGKTDWVKANSVVELLLNLLLKLFKKDQAL